MHEDAQGVRNDLEPCRNVGVSQQVLSLVEPFHLLGTLADIDDVVLGDLVGRHVDVLAVHGEVTVGHQLASLAAGACQTSAVDDVVQAGLEQDDQVVTGLARAAVRLLVVAAELTLENTVGVLSLLLLLQLEQVLRFLDAVAASLSRGVRAALKRHISADKVDAETAGYTGSGAGITSHI